MLLWRRQYVEVLEIRIYMTETRSRGPSCQRAAAAALACWLLLARLLIFFFFCFFFNQTVLKKNIKLIKYAAMSEQEKAKTSVKRLHHTAHSSLSVLALG